MGEPLYDKFTVFKDGEPVHYSTFTLRIDGDDPAAIEALRAYVMATDDPVLAYGLLGVLNMNGESVPIAHRIVAEWERLSVQDIARQAVDGAKPGAGE